MNTNPNATRILCYGDSNTHGRDAKKKSQGIKGRYPADVRWTGQLQIMLGDDFEVIEEGLGGRTTNLDTDGSSEKNGLKYLIPCLSTHVPLDLVILMLGTNDLKIEHHRSAHNIAEANRNLIQTIQKTVENISIILVSPALVDDTNEHALPRFESATEKAKQLAQEYIKVSKECNVSFINLAEYVSPSQYDGVHLDEEDQSKITKILYMTIKKILKTKALL